MLRHNYQQSRAVSVAEDQAAEEHDRLERFMRALERKGRLDRAVEFLPDTVAMRVRAQNRQPLTRPELSVLLAYAKIDLNEEILASDLPDDPRLEEELLRYFPAALQETYPAALKGHRLRREITDAAGRELAGQPLRPDLRTYRRAAYRRDGRHHRTGLHRRARRLEAAPAWSDIEALDPALKAGGAGAHADRLAALRAARRAVDPAPPAAAARHDRRDGPAWPRRRRSWATCPPIWSAKPRARRWANARPPSKRWERLPISRAAPPRSKPSPPPAISPWRPKPATARSAATARLYFRLGERLSLALLANAAQKLPREGLWPSQAALAMQDEIAALHADLLRSALRAAAATTATPTPALAALERTAQARAGARGPAPEGGSRRGRDHRPRHAVGRYRRSCGRWSRAV